MRRQNRQPLHNPARKPSRGPSKSQNDLVPTAPTVPRFPRSDAVRPWLAAAALIALVVLAYLPVWHAGFIWDDDEHVTENPCVVGPLGFKGIWTTSAAVYYPLVLTSFWLQHAIWGLAPLPYHLVNVAMHAACAILLWRTLLRLGVNGAWLGAALWAVHPVQAESVAWITELKNTQSCLFYLLAIAFFLKWRGAGQAAGTAGKELYYALALLCAVLAILSKASTVMLPVVLGLCWWWTDGQWRWRNVLRLAPFLMISAAASGWTIWEQSFHAGALGIEWAQSRPERLVLAGRVIWFYLGKLLWPHPLIFIYPRWTLEATRPAAYLPVVAAVLTMFALWLLRRQRPFLFFAFAYFVISLFPVLGFFNVYFFRYSFVGDHFQYLASIGPLALVGAGLAASFRFLRKRGPLPGPAFGGALLIGLGVLTSRQAGIYQSDKSLWLDTVDKNPSAWMADANLGMCLGAENDWDGAIAYLRESLRLYPKNDDAENSLGIALMAKSDMGGAIEHFNAALAINPKFAQAHNDLGLAFGKTGRLEEAIAHYRRALELDPKLYGSWMNLGNLLERQGKEAEAADCFHKAIGLAPGDPEPLRRLGNAWLALGRRDEAVATLSQALQIAPGNAMLHFNLGTAYEAQGDPTAARAQYVEAVRLEPRFGEAQQKLRLLTAPIPGNGAPPGS